MMFLPSYLTSPTETSPQGLPREVLAKILRSRCSFCLRSLRNRENVGRNVFFYNKKLNLEVESLGVVMYLVTSGRYGGITLAVIDVGVQLWRLRNGKITLP